jgi:hypothetical protein
MLYIREICRFRFCYRLSLAQRISVYTLSRNRVRKASKVFIDRLLGSEKSPSLRPWFAKPFIAETAEGQEMGSRGAGESLDAQMGYIIISYGVI